MTGKNTLLMSLLTLAACAGSVHAQDFSFGTYGGNSNSVASLGEQGTAQARSNAAGNVTSLPRDFFGAAPEEPSPFEPADHSTENMLVLVGLATMFCVGVTITGLSMVRRRPRSTPTRLLVNSH